MAGERRERRAKELRELWRVNPHRVLGMYQHAMQLDVLTDLPRGLTLDAAIESILDKEDERDSSEDSS
jgi:hypothetical protein